MHAPNEATIITFRELLEVAQHAGPVWSLNSEQFNINLLRFNAGDGVAAHVNNEVDVLGVVIEGEALLAVGANEQTVRQGQMFLIPRGAERALRCTSTTFAYLSCHRRRTGLLPS